eukprot:g4910.t1
MAQHLEVASAAHSASYGSNNSNIPYHNSSHGYENNNISNPYPVQYKTRPCKFYANVYTWFGVHFLASI